MMIWTFPIYSFLVPDTFTIMKYWNENKTKYFVLNLEISGYLIMVEVSRDGHNMPLQWRLYCWKCGNIPLYYIFPNRLGKYFSVLLIYFHSFWKVSVFYRKCLYKICAKINIIFMWSVYVIVTSTSFKTIVILILSFPIIFTSRHPSNI